MFGWWLCSGSLVKWGRVRARCEGGVCVQILLFGWHTRFWWGVVEAARARVRCAWAKFKELSPILTARGASYRIKGRIYSACVQSVLIYGTETWAMKADDLRSLEGTERMMVRWMYEVSLKDRKRSEDLYATFLILIVLLTRWGVADWDGLDIWSVRVWMIECLLAEGWWWRGREVGDGVGRHGNSVLGMTWNCLVCILSGRFLGICGGTWFGANV